MPGEEWLPTGVCRGGDGNGDGHGDGAGVGNAQDSHLQRGRERQNTGRASELPGSEPSLATPERRARGGQHRSERTADASTEPSHHSPQVPPYPSAGQSCVRCAHACGGSHLCHGHWVTGGIKRFSMSLGNRLQIGNDFRLRITAQPRKQFPAENLQYLKSNGLDRPQPCQWVFGTPLYHHQHHRALAANFLQGSVGENSHRAGCSAHKRRFWSQKKGGETERAPELLKSVKGLNIDRTVTPNFFQLKFGADTTP